MNYDCFVHRFDAISPKYRRPLSFPYRCCSSARPIVRYVRLTNTISRPNPHICVWFDKNRVKCLTWLNQKNVSSDGPARVERYRFFSAGLMSPAEKFHLKKHQIFRIELSHNSKIDKIFWWRRGTQIEVPINVNSCTSFNKFRILFARSMTLGTVHCHDPSNTLHRLHRCELAAVTMATICHHHRFVIFPSRAEAGWGGAGGGRNIMINQLVWFYRCCASVVVRAPRHCYEYAKN